MRPAKIVVIGGGTGLSVLLRGLKHKPFHLTAIVTVGDDGGSSGKLRKELNMPPPGDVRNVILALSDAEPLMEELFQYRFKQGTGLEGHTIGNLFLAAMTEITGDFTTAIREMRRVLAVSGNVIPVSDQEVTLVAEMEDGEIIEGESKIPKSSKKIKKMNLKPAHVTSSFAAIQAIEKADMIVLGPGSLYTSLIPNLLFPDIVQAIRRSNAKKVYVGNIMTQPGETDSFTASDHLKAIYDHVGEDLFRTVLLNNASIPSEIRMRYEEKGALPVPLDRIQLEKYGFTVLEDNFISIDEEEKSVRHNARKIADALEDLMKIKTQSI